MLVNRLESSTTLKGFPRVLPWDLSIEVPSGFDKQVVNYFYIINVLISGNGLKVPINNLLTPFRKVEGVG